MSDLPHDFASLGRRMRWTRVGLGLVLWLAAVGGAVLALCLLDNLLRLPAALRLTAAVAVLILGLRSLWRRVVVPARTRIPPESAALAAEQAAGITDNRLINACQFAEAQLPASARALVGPVLQRAASTAIPVARLLRLRHLAWWGLGAAAAIGAWAAYAGLDPYRAGNALRRFAVPLADVPAAGAVRISMDPAHDGSLPSGSDLTVRVQISDPQAAPVLWWAEGSETAAENGDGAERVVLAADGSGRWRALLPRLTRSGALRAVCGDAATPAVRVHVQPPPQIVDCSISVTAPAYVGGPAQTVPGPPAAVTALAGSRLELSLTLRPAPALAFWQVGSQTIALARSGERWQGSTTLMATTACSILARTEAGDQELARGTVAVEPDRSPEVVLSSSDTGRLVPPGSNLRLELTATDDHGLRRVELAARDAVGGEPWIIRPWDLMGPPGLDHLKEACTVALEPARFQAGHAYLIEAKAWDWAPGSQPGMAQPLLVRVATLADVTAADPAARDALAALKEAIARQREANGTSDNLAAQLPDVLAGKRLAVQRDACAVRQGKAQAAGKQARDRFAPVDKAAAAALTPVVDGEMGLIGSAFAALPQAKDPATALAAIRERQTYVLAQLIAVLGEAATRDPKAIAAAAADQGGKLPDISAAMRGLGADIAEAVHKQERLLERTRNLLDQAPTDLSDEQAKILGELAREEGKLAAFIQDKIDDFAKLPQQDRSDASLLTEFNAVFQEMSQASAAMYQAKVELAVPHEQSGLELASELQHNLEKWLAQHPDNTKWSMEDALKPADVPLSELGQLEDIVGDLLDKEEAMSADIEDVTSQWMDNLDKGAGWDAGDGPISNMSAKGVTGNVLPNQNEVGGRAGEGRNGRSSGQMVGDEAVGKGGRETPTRLSPGTFESGSVKDSSKDSTGGATGGGKVSGSEAEGLRGPVPPALQQAMQRLAHQQAALKQDVGAVALQLRARRKPSPQLETAVAAMADAADAATKGDAVRLRQRHDAAVDALSQARREVLTSGVARERIDLDRHDRPGQVESATTRVPPGYEAMAERYFRALAESPQP